MSVHVGNGGAWQSVYDAYVGVSNAWQPLKSIHVGAGGTWRQAAYFHRETISVDTLDYNVSTAAAAAGWDGAATLFAFITINSGIYVGSTTTGAAFTVPSLPTGSLVFITNNGLIYGKGGNGGNGGTAGTPTGQNGQVGGLALSVAHATTIDNLSGTVAGGGGGGGGSNYDAGDGDGSGGGGGRGFNPGTGGTGDSSGTAGTKTTAGTGGNTGGNPPAGNGGDLASVGTAAAAGGTGGAAGACTSGNANITWTNTGTRLGTLG